LHWCGFVGRLNGHRSSSAFDLVEARTHACPHLSLVQTGDLARYIGSLVGLTLVDAKIAKWTQHAATA
jgi:hypothetical protein